MSYGWVGFDLDGTLAMYDEWHGPLVIGPPVPRMVDLLNEHLQNGDDVRIFTARVWPLTMTLTSSAMLSKIVCSTPGEEDAVKAARAIFMWTKRVFWRELPLTCVKDFLMQMHYDDRCRQVETNTGRIALLR